MRYIFIFIFSVFLFSDSANAQHLELVSDVGEFAGFFGVNSYNGDIASDVQFIKRNYGAYYKKQLNNYTGLRFNYETINLGVFDGASKNPFDLERNFSFNRNFHEISLISELYFNRFISGRKFYKFSPYMGFGVGYLFKTNVDNSSNFPAGAPNRIITFPINLGLKYSFYKNWNLFVEYKHRKTTSDYIDHFSDVDQYNKVQGSKAGNDDLLSLSFGISYNFRRVYGYDQPPPVEKKKRLPDSRFGEEKVKKRSSFNLFKIFKRK